MNFSDLISREHNLKNNLPYSVINGQKRGFSFPVKDWIRESIQNELEQVLFDHSTIDFWNYEYLDKIWALFLKGKINWNVIWTVFVFNKWYQNKF